MNIDDRRPTDDPRDLKAHSHTLENFKWPYLSNASSEFGDRRQ